MLGGGGSSGNAWLIGVVAGLADAGLDVVEPDLTIGTSAGATTAAQFTGTPPRDLFVATMDAVHPSRPTGGRAVSDQLDRTARIIASAAGPDDMRRRLGEAALELAADGSWQERWRAMVASRLPSASWPLRAMWLTAVNARTGAPVEFSRDSGIDLVDAVAASCSSGPAYRIGEELYIDGGYRANADNADLAAGCSRVLVLSPFGGRARTPRSWGLQLEDQVAVLRARGAVVESVFPPAEAEDLFGMNATDLSLRPRAAETGFNQGRALAERLAPFWTT